MKQLLPVGCFLVVCVLSAYAQPTPARFEQLSPEEGLSQSTVYSIVQDQRGFMWFGTQDGLNKYDGYTFTVYKRDRQDSSSIGGNWIWAIYEDRMGYIWIGTDGGGLNRFDPATDAFTRYDVCSDRIRAIYEDRQGGLWLGTTDEGLCRLDRATGQVVRYAHDPSDAGSLSHNAVLSILETRQGVLWAGTGGGGLNRLNASTGTFVRYRHDPSDPNSLSSDVVGVLHEDHRGRLWVGTEAGLNRWDGEGSRFVSYRFRSPRRNALLDNDVAAIVDEGPDVLWVGMNGGGLYRFEVSSGAVIHYAKEANGPNSLRSNDILALKKGWAGTLWIGTGGSGLFKLLPTLRPFISYQSHVADANTLSHDIVRAFAEDPQGRIWIGTAAGLDRFDLRTGTFRHYLPDPSDSNSLSGRNVRALALDQTGRLWIGMYGGGLDRLDPQAKVFQRHRHDAADPGSLSSDVVLALRVDRKGQVWAGTDAGLNRFDPATGTFTHYKHDAADPFSLSADHVVSLYEDRAGLLWVGTADGLSRLDPLQERFVSYRHDPQDPHSISSNYVFAVHEDRDGFLWVGTREGLNRLDRAAGTFRHYGVRDGLPNEVVYGILEDEEGCLWLSTNNGLVRFDPSTERFTNYHTHDGLPSNEFNAGASYKSRRGQLYFGSIQGFVTFYPDQIRHNTRVPPVVLTDFEVFGKPFGLPQSITVIDEIRLSHRESFFAFEFAVLDYIAPERNRYAYKLEGLDEAWIDAGTRRYVSYSDVAPGRYVFRVRGANSDGVWNEEGAAVRLIVTAPFWGTWWFYVFASGLVAGFLLAAYRWRVHQLLEVERTRARIADDLHDAIGSKMSSIALMVELSSRSARMEPAERYRLADAAHTARQLVDELRDTVWVIDTGHDTLADLIARMRQVVRQMLQCVDHVVLLPEDPPPVLLRLELRRNILMIFKEALHNAVRHAGASTIEVRVTLEENVLSVCVRDDGLGFDRRAVQAGRGFYTMQARAEQIGGELKIRSRPGQGTMVRLTVKTV